MSSLRLPTSCMLRTASWNRNSSALTKRLVSLEYVRRISKAHSLKTTSTSGFRICAMAVYKLKLIGPNGEENVIEAPDDAYILDSAENANIDLPYSCRAGACSSCAGKIVSGSVDQSDGSFLDENQMNEGYLLTCIAYPTSDCEIRTHREQDLY